MLLLLAANTLLLLVLGLLLCMYHWLPLEWDEGMKLLFPTSLWLLAALVWITLALDLCLLIAMRL